VFWQQAQTSRDERVPNANVLAAMYEPQQRDNDSNDDDRNVTGAKQVHIVACYQKANAQAHHRQSTIFCFVATTTPIKN
jgi:hypothetical protein